ncbi:MAG: serine hydrolase domain-containing protein [Pseudomonadota bacterium]
MSKTLRQARLLVSVLFVVLLSNTSSVLAKEIPSTKPEREGFSSQRLDRLTQHMNARVEDGTMVGGMGVIARNGRIVYSETYGQADREAGRAMEADAIYRIYSMTKPITAVAVMMLHEEGKFFLNDPVAWYLPELADLQLALSTADGNTGIVSDGTQSRGVGEADESKVGQTRKPARQPTIRDLLTHTAGMTYGVFGNTEVDQAYRKAQLLGPHLTLKEFTERLGQIPLQYEPGSRWHYSVSVDVQGALVERVSGMSFGEFLQTRLFDPLDMRDTSFFIRPESADRVAQIYSPEGVGNGGFFAQPTGPGLEVAPAQTNAGYQPGAKFEGGGGGLLSTARDYLRFSQMMLNGGVLDGERILSPKTIELMTTNHIGELPLGFNRRGSAFGLGYAVVLDPGQTGEIGSAGEYNWGGAAGTRFWIDPEEQLIGLFMVQSIPHRTRLAGEFKSLVYQALTE